MGGRKKPAMRDHAAAKELFEAKQGLIGACISRKWGLLVAKMGMDAVWQQGNLGLLRACELWDGRNELSTYATAYINGYLRTLNRYGPATSRRIVSRETTQHYVLQSLIPSELGTPADEALCGERRTRLRKFLRRVLLMLEKRDARVLYYRSQGLTLDAVGVKLRVTRERVRQIETRARLRIQESAEWAELVHEFQDLMDAA